MNLHSQRDPASDDPLTVLFIPFYGANPYQRELSTALRNRGVTVLKGDHTNPLPLLGQLIREQPDIVHLHWVDHLLISRNPLFTALLSVRLFAELLICRLLGIRIVWTVHNLLDHDRRYPRYELYCRRVIAHLSDVLIAHSPTAKRKVEEAYRITEDSCVEVVSVPHGHYINNYENDVSRAEARERLGLPHDETVYCFFGNIRPYKGVDILIDTFNRSDSDSRLLLAGRLPQNEKAAELIERACDRNDSITTEFGFIPEEDVQLYMNAADAVVLPFRHMLTSGSAILAMSFKRAVIAPRLGSLPDLFQHSQELLYDPNAEDGLERALERGLVADLDGIGQQNYEYVSQFNWDYVAKRTREGYETTQDAKYSSHSGPLRIVSSLLRGSN